MKKTLLALALLAASVSTASAGTLTVTLVEGGQTTLTKVWTIPDADIDRMQQAYQSAANTSVNGTATRAQVFGYVFDKEIVKDVTAVVTQFFTVHTPGTPPSFQ